MDIKLKSNKNHKNKYVTTLSNKDCHFFYEPELNGESCPICKNELYDETPNTTYVADYILKSVGCASKNCDYQAMRMV
jgi:hypothetical protein